MKAILLAIAFAAGAFTADRDAYKRSKLADPTCTFDVALCAGRCVKAGALGALVGIGADIPGVLSALTQLS